VTKSKRIKSIADIAKNRELSAAQVLGQKRQFLQQQRGRLDELITYRQEYSHRFETSGNEGFNARQLNEFRTFFNKLNQAIVQQRDLISHLDKECHVCQENWMSKRVNSQAIGKVVEKYQHREICEQEKREQLDLDERAQRLGLVPLED